MNSSSSGPRPISPPVSSPAARAIKENHREDPVVHNDDDSPVTLSSSAQTISRRAARKPANISNEDKVAILKMCWENRLSLLDLPKAGHRIQQDFWKEMRIDAHELLGRAPFRTWSALKEFVNSDVCGQRRKKTEGDNAPPRREDSRVLQQLDTWIDRWVSIVSFRDCLETMERSKALIQKCFGKQFLEDTCRGIIYAPELSALIEQRRERVEAPRGDSEEPQDLDEIMLAGYISEEESRWTLDNNPMESIETDDQIREKRAVLEARRKCKWFDEAIRNGTAHLDIPSRASPVAEARSGSSTSAELYPLRSFSDLGNDGAAYIQADENDDAESDEGREVVLELFAMHDVVSVEESATNKTHADGEEPFVKERVSEQTDQIVANVETEQEETGQAPGAEAAPESRARTRSSSTSKTVTSGQQQKNRIPPSVISAFSAGTTAESHRGRTASIVRRENERYARHNAKRFGPVQSLHPFSKNGTLKTKEGRLRNKQVVPRAANDPSRPVDLQTVTASSSSSSNEIELRSDPAFGSVGMEEDSEDDLFPSPRKLFSNRENLNSKTPVSFPMESVTSFADVSTPERISSSGSMHPIEQIAEAETTGEKRKRPRTPKTESKRQKSTPSIRRRSTSVHVDAARSEAGATDGWTGSPVLDVYHPGMATNAVLPESLKCRRTRGQPSTSTSQADRSSPATSLRASRSRAEHLSRRRSLEGTLAPSSSLVTLTRQKSEIGSSPLASPSVRRTKNRKRRKQKEDSTPQDHGDRGVVTAFHKGSTDTEQQEREYSSRNEREGTANTVLFTSMSREKKVDYVYSRSRTLMDQRSKLNATWARLKRYSNMIGSEGEEED